VLRRLVLRLPACPSTNTPHATCALTRGSRALKELLSVIVDVSPTMHGVLPVISAALTEFVHKKVCCAFCVPARRGRARH
jgi:hypothetical protein